jgi:hypothetical protein
MKHSIQGYLVSALLCGGGVLDAMTARADDFDCPPDRGAEVIDGNIIVVGECRLEGTLVKGNVFLEDNGGLGTEAATIIGNIQTDGAERVRVSATTVNGDIQLTGVNGTSRSEVVDSMIGGTLNIEDNTAQFVLEGNVVGSDLKANFNGGGVNIQGNDIDGNLQCQGNDPPPTGGDNVVGGNKEDQCENLQPGSSTTTSSSTTTTTLPSNGICGDHNGDGMIGSTDSLLVLNKAIGIDVVLQCPVPAN